MLVRQLSYSLIFSPQEDAAEQVVALVRDNPEFTTVIGMHTLGKEDLLVRTLQQLPPI